MKKLTTLLFCCFSFAIYAQVYISGVVYDIDNNPLEGASVYINNTSVGTTTNTKGEFSLNLPKGIYQLVVSYIGFDSERYPLNTNTYKNPLVFKLIEKDNMLDEVVIERKKKMTKAKKKAYLRKFKKEFLGKSKFAKSCVILNEEILDFDFDPITDILEVSASAPIKVVNKALGYKISYDLLHFELTPLSVTYLGNVKYDKLNDSDSKKKKWIANRLEAYYGSKMHFLRSVVNERVKEEGYIVDHFERIRNPKRPTYEEIKAAEKVLNKTSGLQRDPFGRSDVPNSELSKAREVLKKSQLSEFVDKEIKKNLYLREYALYYEGEYNLKFSDYIRITYLKEKPDSNYDPKKGNSRYQVSMILLYNKVAEIRKSGVFKNPLDVFLQGYWAFEKVGDALPLDYKPD